MKIQHQFILIAIISLLGYRVETSAAVQPFSPAAAGTDIKVKPKFGDMSIHDRNSYLDKIGQQDFAASMQEWLDAGRIEDDFNKQTLIRLKLGYAMKKRTPPPEFFAQIKTFIEDASNSNLEREEMIALLGEAATKESMDLLIAEANILKPKNLKDKAVGAIGAVGESQDEKLAPALDQLWRDSKDQQMLMAASLSMAKIGAPSSISLLLSAALAPESLDNARKLIGKGALTTVISRRAVPSLAAALAHQSPTSPQAMLAFKTLTQIVDVSDRTAITTLITWLQNADSNAAPLAHDWIAHAKGSPELRAAEAALDPSVPFRSEANREALRTGLSERNSHRTFVPAGAPLK